MTLHRAIAELTKATVKRAGIYHHLHVARHAGWRHLVRRERVVREIDRVPPRHTRPWRPGASGLPAEVHMLVRRQDARMALWALHSFYEAAGVDWPVVFHQGGPMARRDWARLADKFPDAGVMTAREADVAVEPLLRARSMSRAVEVRRRSPMLRKLLDPVLLSGATSLLVADSDVLFFHRPDEVLGAAGRDDHPNTFNRDAVEYPYNLTAADSLRRFGVAPARSLNAGLSLLNRLKVRLDRAETYLGDPLVTAAPFFVEQTIHGLLAGEFGHALLPETYACSTRPGLSTAAGEPLVAKHYINTPRPLFFEEGIPAVQARAGAGAGWSGGR